MSAVIEAVPPGMLKGFLATKAGRIVFWAAIIIAAGAFVWLTAPKTANVPAADTSAPLSGNLPPAPEASAGADVNANAGVIANKPKAPAKKPAAQPAGFAEKKIPHLISSSIANNATIAQVPSFLTLTFDASLQKSTQTTLTVKKDDITSATLAPSSIQDNKLIVQLNPQVTDGAYYAYYVACFADTGCADGRFGYTVKLP